MKRINEFVDRRRTIADFYNNSFKNIDSLVLQKEEKFCKSSWHIYIIKLDCSKLKVGRKEVFDALRAENIGVNVHYVPVYFHPYYRQIGYERGICPLAENLYNNIITLPLFPSMTIDDTQDVVKAVNKVISFYHI